MAAERVEVTLKRLHAGQEAALAAARRFNMLCCGRRWGKTTLGVELAAMTAIEGRPAGWFAPTYKLLTEAWGEIKRTLAPLIVHRSEQEKRVELLTGGVVECWTLDRDDPARGRKYARVVIDEAAMVRNLLEKWQQAIRPTLADFRGDAWFLTTPKGMRNDFAHLWEAASQRPEWSARSAPTSENPAIDPAEIEAARDELPELVFRQEFLAEFVALDGAVMRREWIRRGARPAIDRRWRVAMGVDLAISTREDADYTAAAVIARNPEGEIWVLDARRARAPFHESMQWIERIARRWNPAVVAVEEVQYQAAAVQELLRRTTLPVVGVRPDKDKLTRFLPLLARYEQLRVWHADDLPGDFEDELLAFPMGEHDDMVDAAAHAFAALDRAALPVAVRPGALDAPRTLNTGGWHGGF